METKLTLQKEEYPAIIIGKLMNIGGILQREGNRLLLPFQLNQQQFAILFEIAKVKEVQQKNMVNRLMLEKAHVSKVVKKLQAMELIDITPMPEDKRSTKISMTVKGQKLVDECRAMFQKWNREWFEEFDLNQLQQMLDSLDLLQKSFVKKHSK